ncbi:MAG TPA: TAT-variant-translocated molybdopterin oxidoreductase [Bacteroidota bacterium]|nr:TAT-variant-translocated molybdopterin oxidoreductase [Bacteroidota bacterium]
MSGQDAYDPASLRRRLSQLSGREYWRSLGELAHTEEFRELLRTEFPRFADVPPAGLSRRKFLSLMGASLALAGLSSCTKQPDEEIVPYVKSPELVVPGEPLYYATAFQAGGYARGVIATSHMGRPTKLEGNPDHPASLGAIDAITQASILGLYDPDRSQVVTHRGAVSTWAEFRRAFETRGERIAILTGTMTSPTLAAQMAMLFGKLPRARWYTYEPVPEDALRDGAVMAFGRPLATHYRFDRADVVVALDADFLQAGAAGFRYAHDFSTRRRIRDAQADINRLYVAESTPSITGAAADHRFAIRPGGVEGVAVSLGRLVGAPGWEGAPAGADGLSTELVAPMARDLLAHRGRSIVIPGLQQGARVHAMAHVINRALGNIGETVYQTDPVAFGDPGPGAPKAPPQAGTLGALVAAMQAGEVETLVIIGCNPAYDAPADVPFLAALERVSLTVHSGLYSDETAAACHWHVPGTHFLEEWSDARAFDGTATIVQPLIAPLYDGKSVHELVALMAGEDAPKGYDIVRAHWQSARGKEGFESFWKKSLNDGYVAGTALPPLDAVPALPGGFWNAPPREALAPGGELDICFLPDPSIRDGRDANNGWLQELPRPITRLTWDNAAMFSPADAERLGVATGDVVELSLGGRSLEAPALVLPGEAPGVVTLHLGYGRTRSGNVGTGAGVSAYTLRTSGAPWFAGGLGIRSTGRRAALAITQEHHAMEGRHQVRSATRDEYLKNPAFAREEDPPGGGSLYPRREYPGYAWGMTVDLHSCIGCNACVTACQAENNIPVVGKEQVLDSREMHWIRVDTYFTGDVETPETMFQPVMCQQCEDAPCELVCPVGATVHDSEGLNVMVYNRCIGTRYCSNNCPYKVRRFNFLQYTDEDSPTLKMQRNPDVTVRSRGVMEKCTYCIQRINGARITAEKEGRPIRDGDVVTACQSACPAGAIVFGNVNDPESRVSRLKARERNYALLGELNTRPRTTYLAKVTNPLRAEEEIETKVSVQGGPLAAAEGGAGGRRS